MDESQKNIIRWLHLSDFHVGRDDYAQRMLFKQILKHVIYKKKQGLIPDLIFITGDVAYKGKSTQYKNFVVHFLRPLYAIVGEEKKSYTFVVPGNHDVCREVNQYLDREATCKKDSRFFDPTKEGKKERQQTTPRFRAYTNSSLAAHNWINTPEGSYAELVTIRDTTLGVLGINTAWLSLDENDRHKLSPGVNLLNDAFDKLQNCNIKIVLGHHPIEWFRDEQIQEIKTILSEHNALYLHGHLHKDSVNLDGDGFLCVQSGAAFITRDNDKWVHSLMWGKLNLAQGVLHLQSQEWKPGKRGWSAGINLPEKRKVPAADWWEYPLPRKAPHPKHVLSPSELPDGIQPMYQEQVGFTGRNREIQGFEQFLKSEDLVLNFHGISGIGKSWLLNRLLKDLLTGRSISDFRVANIDCKEIGGDLQEFMRLIARNIGESRLPKYIASKNKNYEKSGTSHLFQQDVDDLWDLLFLDLQTVSKTEMLIIFIDSFEKVQGTPIGNRIRTAFKNYFGNCSNNGLKVVIGSQESVHASQGWPRLQHVEIKVFSPEELVEFAENILGTSDKALIDYLVDAWKGYPLELGQLVGRRFGKNQGKASHLLAQLRKLRPEYVAATDSSILKGLRERLGDDNLGILAYCAVPRWFDASVLRTLGGLDVTTSQSLIKRLSQWWFVKPQTRGGYEIHEKCRGPLLRSLIQDDRDMFSKWSKLCYEYLQSNEINMGGSSGTSREIESVYHLMTFNAKDALLRYNDLRYSFGQGNRLDLMTFLQDTVEQHIDINLHVDKVFQHWVKYGRAIINYKSGEEDQALQKYEELLETLQHPDTDDLTFLRARILCAKGDLPRWRSGETHNADVAMSCYQEAIGLWSSLLEEKENVVSAACSRDEILKSIAETYRSMAQMEETKGSLLEGLKHFESALVAYRLCEVLGPSYGRTLTWMARSLRLSGKWKEAHRRFDEAEEAFNSLLKKAVPGEYRLTMRVEEIHTQLQNVRNARAALWKEEGKWMEAKEVLEQVVAFHNDKPKETINREELGIALIDLGDVLRMQENYLNAKQVYKEAQKNLQTSKRNKGFPLLGLAEIAVVDGNEEEAVEFLSKAEEAFREYKDFRKLSEISLCRTKLGRKVNPVEALANLEKAWEEIRQITCTYAKSAVLVELSELVYEAEHDSKRCSNYRQQAIALASQKQGLFADHLARLNFIDGRIAGEEESVHALPSFIKAMAWAVLHNPLTLQRTFSQAIAWKNARLSTGTKIANGKAEALAQEAEAIVWQSEDIALSTLPEESQAAFKDAVAELKRLFV